MSRLEQELGQAESVRQKEVNACARSAAEQVQQLSAAITKADPDRNPTAPLTLILTEQVQQLSAAIMKADRMLAEATLENERLARELQAAHASHDTHVSELHCAEGNAGGVCRPLQRQQTVRLDKTTTRIYKECLRAVTQTSGGLNRYSHVS